jgi:hypothetical protein
MFLWTGTAESVSKGAFHGIVDPQQGSAVLPPSYLVSFQTQLHLPSFSSAIPSSLPEENVQAAAAAIAFRYQQHVPDGQRGLLRVRASVACDCCGALPHVIVRNILCMSLFVIMIQGRIVIFCLGALHTYTINHNHKLTHNHKPKKIRSLSQSLSATVTTTFAIIIRHQNNTIQFNFNHNKLCLNNSIELQQPQCCV